MLHQTPLLKKIIKEPAVVINGKALQLPISKQGKGHYLPILQITVDQLDAMLSHHCKVLVLRLDLRLHMGSPDNRVMSSFIHRYRNSLQNKGFKRIGYVWCREQDTSHAQHYHCVFLLDGNKARHPHNIIKAIEHLWEDWELGSVYTPGKCYRLLKRDDSDGYQTLFERLSYLAKVATKSNRAVTTNDYSASRIKPK